MCSQLLMRFLKQTSVQQHVCVCTRHDHTLFMVPVLGAKTWIKGSGQQQICLRFVIVSVQTVKCVKSDLSDQGSFQWQKECWEILPANSCFPSSSTYGHHRREFWTVETLSQTKGEVWGQGSPKQDVLEQFKFKTFSIRTQIGGKISHY